MFLKGVMEVGNGQRKQGKDERTEWPRSVFQQFVKFTYVKHLHIKTNAVVLGCQDVARGDQVVQMAPVGSGYLEIHRPDKQ